MNLDPPHEPFRYTCLCLVLFPFQGSHYFSEYTMNYSFQTLFIVGAIRDHVRMHIMQSPDRTRRVMFPVAMSNTQPNTKV